MRYDYRCENMHLTEAIHPIACAPEHTPCTEPGCGLKASRVFSAPAAILFRGSGFYTTDVKGRVGRRRRANPGDDLHKEFDTAAARIADAI